MYFLEQWFGLYPDGGTGMLELSVIVGALILVFALTLVPAKLSWSATLARGWFATSHENK